MFCTLQRVTLQAAKVAGIERFLGTRKQVGTVPMPAISRSRDELPGLVLSRSMVINQIRVPR
jgi:hypothetical protein